MNWKTTVNIESTDCLSQLPVRIYGDESFSDDIATYSLVLLENVMAEEALLKRWNGVIQKFGQAANTRIHARQLFSGHARAKTQWGNLSEIQVNELFLALADCLIEQQPLIVVGLTHSQMDGPGVPSGIGKNGEQLYTLPTPEHCYVNAFYAAILTIKNFGISLEPSRCQLFIDKQSSKIKHWAFDKRASVEKLIAVAGISPTNYEIEPLLLDMADLVAYTCSRGLSVTGSRNKDVCLEVVNRIKPKVSQGFFDLGAPPMEALNRVSGLLGVGTSGEFYDAYHDTKTGAIGFEPWREKVNLQEITTLNLKSIREKNLTSETVIERSLIQIRSDAKCTQI